MPQHDRAVRSDDLEDTSGVRTPVAEAIGHGRDDELAVGLLEGAGDPAHRSDPRAHATPDRGRFRLGSFRQRYLAGAADELVEDGLVRDLLVRPRQVLLDPLTTESSHPGPRLRVVDEVDDGLGIRLDGVRLDVAGRLLRGHPRLPKI